MLHSKPPIQNVHFHIPVRESRSRCKVSQRALGNCSARVHYAGTRAVSSSATLCHGVTIGPFLLCGRNTACSQLRFPKVLIAPLCDNLRRVRTPAWRRLFFCKPIFNLAARAHVPPDVNFSSVTRLIPQALIKNSLPFLIADSWLKAVTQMRPWDAALPNGKYKALFLPSSRAFW